MVKLSELRSMGGYNLCTEGHREFEARFGDSATYSQAFTLMHPRHCVSYIIQLIKLDNCPSVILNSIPIKRTEENRFTYCKYLLKNWDEIKSNIIINSQALE